MQPNDMNNQPPMGPAMQPMPGSMPPQNNPMMGQPMGQGPIPNQPTDQPMGQPMGQSMGQSIQPAPMMKPPKQPMDPKKKKTIILVSAICGGVLILGIAAAIILPIILRVDYSEAYKTAASLKDEIYEIYQDYDCEYVETKVDSGYYSVKEYAEHVEKCRSVGEKAETLIAELEQTAGVQRNSDIRSQFDAFKTIYDSNAVDNETKAETLDIYTIWHNFAVLKEELDSWDETDADLSKAGNVLINSGNEQLKAYGEGWLEKRKAAAAAYRAYYAASYSDKNKSALRETMQDAQKQYNNYVAEKKPNITEIASLANKDNSKMKQAFDKLYSAIKETYEKNYNKGSGDCWELMGEVVCD